MMKKVLLFLMIGLLLVGIKINSASRLAKRYAGTLEELGLHTQKVAAKNPARVSLRVTEKAYEKVAKLKPGQEIKTKILVKRDNGFSGTMNAKVTKVREGELNILPENASGGEGFKIAAAGAVEPMVFAGGKQVGVQRNTIIDWGDLSPSQNLQLTKGKMIAKEVTVQEPGFPPIKVKVRLKKGAHGKVEVIPEQASKGLGQRLDESLFGAKGEMVSGYEVDGNLVATPKVVVMPDKKGLKERLTQSSNQQVIREPSINPYWRDPNSVQVVSPDPKKIIKGLEQQKVRIAGNPEGIRAIDEYIAKTRRKLDFAENKQLSIKELKQIVKDLEQQKKRIPDNPEGIRAINEYIAKTKDRIARAEDIEKAVTKTGISAEAAAVGTVGIGGAGAAAIAAQ